MVDRYSTFLPNGWPDGEPVEAVSEVDGLRGADDDDDNGEGEAEVAEEPAHIRPNVLQKRYGRMAAEIRRVANEQLLRAAAPAFFPCAEAACSGVFQSFSAISNRCNKT